VGHRIACYTDKRLEIVDPSGLRFEVEYENCDTIAKDEAISVYASKSTPKGAGMFSRWRKQRTLLFRYDPGSGDIRMPSITRTSTSTILISIPEVSSIFYRNREWANVSVNYAIGKVDYPH
jgi:hypothetical protein